MKMLIFGLEGVQELITYLNHLGVAVGHEARTVKAHIAKECELMKSGKKYGNYEKVVEERNDVVKSLLRKIDTYCDEKNIKD